jgi:hypothetical protein
MLASMSASFSTSATLGTLGSFTSAGTSPFPTFDFTRTSHYNISKEKK